MLRHYLTMAARTFARRRLYTLINVVGLSVALACAILILVFVRDQLSWDHWLSGTNNLYRLELTAHPPGSDSFETAQAPFPLIRAVGDQVPQVAAVTHVVPEKMTVTVGKRQFLETVTVVDPNFLRVFALPLLEGSRTGVLAQPESVVLSETMAHKYFGNADPVGKVLEWGVRALDVPVSVSGERDVAAGAKADIFPAYDDDGGLLLVLTPDK